MDNKSSEKRLGTIYFLSNKTFCRSFPLPENFKGKTKKYDVDGIWTLASRDDQPCKATEAMVIEETKL